MCGPVLGLITSLMGMAMQPSAPDAPAPAPMPVAPAPAPVPEAPAVPVEKVSEPSDTLDSEAAKTKSITRRRQAQQRNVSLLGTDDSSSITGKSLLGE